MNCKHDTNKDGDCHLCSGKGGCPMKRIKFEYIEMPFPFESRLNMIVAINEAREVLGTVTFKFDDCICEFERLYVHEQIRRKGIARELLQRVIRHAQEAGMRSVSCTVATRNYPAHLFYHELGFRPAVKLDEATYLFSLPVPENVLTSPHRP